jgi:Ino eighty subunit 2
LPCCLCKIGAFLTSSYRGTLDETSRKKKQLNEAEIALRREETARKRKHLSEKKLEDEKVRIAHFPSNSPSRSSHPTRAFPTKAETINRLLKKKSGTRNRRNPLASAEDRTPASHTGNGTPAEGEVDEDESPEVVAPPVIEVVPTRYRWISTLRPSPDAPPGDKMLLSFSIPTSLLPMSHQPPTVDADGDTKMEAQEKPKSRDPAVCDVDGCTVTRKYRLVRDHQRGACGMDHLHILEKQLGVAAV